MRKPVRALLALLLILTLAGCGGLSPSAGVTTARPRVAVIVKSTGSSFWKSVRAGVNAAASEYNIDFSFDGPLSEEDYATQNRMIRQAVQEGVDAIVFSAIDHAASVAEIEAAADAGIHIVVIDSDVDSDRVAVRIGTDNYAAGRVAARALLDMPSSALMVGVVGFDVRTENGQARERGFLDGLAEDDRAQVVETLNLSSNSASVQAETRAMLARHPEINAIVTFNEITTLGVGHAIEELGVRESVHVVGFDNNVVSVGMLETGEIDVLMVQNPFAIGYLGLENAALLAAGKTPPADRIDTEVRAIGRADMYTEENQRFLFSFTENQT